MNVAAQMLLFMLGWLPCWLGIFRLIKVLHLCLSDPAMSLEGGLEYLIEPFMSLIGVSGVLARASCALSSVLCAHRNTADSKR